MTPSIENNLNPDPDSYMQLIKELNTCQELLKLLIQKIEIFKDVVGRNQKP